MRIEFAVGDSAVRHVEKHEANLNAIAVILGSSKEKVIESLEKVMADQEAAKRTFRLLVKKTSDLISENILQSAKVLSTGIKIYSYKDEGLGEEYSIAIGERSIEKDPTLVFVSLVLDGKGIRVIVFVGSRAQKILSAGKIAKEISGQLGGSGGGNDRFGQGGGKHFEKIDECIKNIEKTIINLCTKKKNG